MKKRILFLTLLTLVMTCVIMCFFGCSEEEEEVYNLVQYTDDDGLHTITATPGEFYELKTIPEKEGHQFLGLYDAAVGGIQYVNDKGVAVVPFAGDKNLMLYPQYQINTYTVVLDFGEAPVVGSRSYEVTWGANIPALPTNCTIEHKVFEGWFTEPDCGGTQIADEYSFLAGKSTVNSKNFDLTDPEGVINLYAGFTWEKHDVTFYFGTGMSEEVMKVSYGTPISQVVPKTRKDGKAVLTWSKRQNDTEGAYLFTGKIEGDTVLYAAEWAPVIELDTTGGDEAIPVVARPGSAITLPSATREHYKFLYWRYAEGGIAEITTMPNESITLCALWQAMVVFDENGGNDVADVSQLPGFTIQLPVPTREGYLFAGWYNEAKEVYTSTTMPMESVVLKAGWYKAKEKTFVMYKGNEYASVADGGPKWCTFDLSKLNGFNAEGLQYYQVDIKVKIKPHSVDYSLVGERGDYYSNVTVALYSKNTYSTAYQISSSETYPHENAQTYQSKEYSALVRDNDGVIYLCFKGDRVAQWVGCTAYFYISDLSAVVSYPDTSVLYL